MPDFPDFERVYPPDDFTPDESTVWVLPSSKGLLVRKTGGRIELPRTPAVLSKQVTIGKPLPLARRDGVPYVSATPADAFEPDDDWQWLDLRSLYGQVAEHEWLIAGYAAQVAHWQCTSGYCPICGSEMGPMASEWRRRCTRCGHERYPIVSPAVLALVHDGDRILLAHKPGWGARRSILAGFVLPGESLEKCVHREVLEEAGVQVTDLAYFGSQPWPFPHQLMIGFTCRYVSGDIVIDKEELEGADWYDSSALPPLPPQLSLSRQMIDAWADARHPAHSNA